MSGAPVPIVRQRWALLAVCVASMTWAGCGPVVGPREPAGSAAFAAASGVFIRSNGGATRNVVLDVCAPQFGISGLALAPGGTILAFTCSVADSMGYRTVLHLLDVPTGTTNRIADDVAGGPGRLAWSPQGRYLAYQVATNLGPAPVAASALWVYDVVAGQRTQIDKARYFSTYLTWDPDGSAVIYTVGSWQYSTQPVWTYRAPLDGSGGTAWAENVQAVAPGPKGEWLGVREPPQRPGGGQAILVGADGKSRPLTAGDTVELPVGWLGTEPVVWRPSAVSDPTAERRGDIWVAGATPRCLLVDVPELSAYTGKMAVVEGRLLYVDEARNGSVALVSLASGKTSHLADQGRTPVSLALGN